MPAAFIDGQGPVLNPLRQYGFSRLTTQSAEEDIVDILGSDTR
jgi:hypothetical protein